MKSITRKPAKESVLKVIEPSALQEHVEKPIFFRLIKNA